MSTTTKAMLRKALAEAQAANAAHAVTAHQVPACSCQHHPAADVAPAAQAGQIGATLNRGFQAAPVLAAGGALLGVVTLLGMVTAALLAVALTGLALAVTSVVLVLLVKMLKKETGQ